MRSILAENQVKRRLAVGVCETVDGGEAPDDASLLSQHIATASLGISSEGLAGQPRWVTEPGYPLRGAI